MSPEEVAARSNGKISSSYLRRVEKGVSVPTVEMLAQVLEVLGSNLGMFFEYLLDNGTNIEAQDRRYHHILQRALERHRADTMAVMRLLERQVNHE